jgi:hypothetical protein
MLREETTMRKSKRDPLKPGAPAAARRRTAKVLVVALALAFSLCALVVAGQQGGAMAKKEAADRFEHAIKAREPRFTLVSKLKRKNPEEDYVLLGWKSGAEFVSATTYELASAEEAAAFLKSSVEAPVSVPVRTVKLTHLGEEAYIRADGPYSKEGYTTLLFRKGNVVVVMSASAQGVARRFAKHMARELGN